MVYQILGGDSSNSSSSNTESHIDVIGFKTEDGMLVPIVSQVAITNTKRADHARESRADEASSSYNVDGLRRSKRRHVQPERYVGCEVKALDVGTFRNMPPVRIETSKVVVDEMSLPLSFLFRLPQSSPEKGADKCQKAKKPNAGRELLVYNRRAKTQEVKKSCGNVDQKEHKNPLAIIPLPDQDADPIAVEHCDLNSNIARSHQSCEITSQYSHLVNNPKPRKNINLLDVPGKSDDAEKNYDVSSRCQFFGTPKLQRKSTGDLDDMDLGNRWEGIKRKSKTGFHEGKYRSTHLRNNGEGRSHTYKDRTLNAAAYKSLINSYLQNINTIPVIEEAPITDQWKKCNTTNSVGKNVETEISHGEDDVEKAEIDMLWKELEVSLASSYFDDSEV